MSDEQISSTVTSIIEAYDRVKGYFDGYQPDKRSVNYDFRNNKAEMTLKITVPQNLGRHFRGKKRGKVQIPLEEGFRFVDMFSAGDFKTVNAAWRKTDTHWILDPLNLPAGKNYLVRLEKTGIDDDIFGKIVDYSIPEDPMDENGNDVYYLQSNITEPKLFKDVYDEFRVDNVDVAVKVAVEGCFSTAIPDRVTKSIRRTQRLIRASNQNDYRELRQVHRLRKGTKDSMEVSEFEAAQIIRNLASAEKFQDYVNVTSPYRREAIDRSNEQGFIPDNVTVDVTTDLNLDQPAAKGKLQFQKEEYTEFIEEETEDLA